MINQDFEFNNDFLKEVELEKERDYLEMVIRTIKAEIINYIEKRKNFGEYILEYRKNNLDEYRDDEDKIIEYFDHERFVKEEAFKVIDRKLKELLTLQYSPYFGRVQFVETDEDEVIYIGRFGVTPEGSYEPLVIDWRAPIASLFYAGKLGSATYKAPMGDIDVNILSKRQYVIKKGELVGMFDSALDVKDDILQMVLSKSSSEKLKDIIMTIQQEQDEIIRQPYDISMVVDGVAGSGKTTIALHRIAYLLYNYREKLEDRVLVLGPNNIFMEYISMVLPSLGEVGVKQKTFREFAEELLGIDNVMPMQDYMERIYREDKEFIEDIIRKDSDSFIDCLDNYIDDMNKHYFKYDDISLMGRLVANKSDIDDLFNLHYISLPLFRRSRKIRRILFSKIKDVRDELVREIEAEYKAEKDKLSDEDRQLHINNLQFQRKNKIRDVIRAVLDVKASMGWLNNPQLIDLYNEFNGYKELIVDDLAPLLYLMLKLNGKGKNNNIKHVVIDEAQDYSQLQFKVIRELTGCISMTVVGDCNQRLIPHSGNIPLRNLDGKLPGSEFKYFKLNKSYRSTVEIISHANGYIDNSESVPLVRQGNKVQIIESDSYENCADEIKLAVENMKNNGCDTIGIICANEERLLEIEKALKGKVQVKVIDDEDKIYSGHIVLITSYFAKGLEFDGAVVFEDKSGNTNYVMATRALHELTVVRLVDKNE